MLGRPENVGIKALEIYFPNQCVDQAELEKHHGISQGKYTIGLGQTKMSFCDDREDLYSFALTTLASLLRKYAIDPRSIGRLEVGTETLLDKSKSCKSVLMQLFEECGNTDIEGVDTINACYGGTNALFNAINWIESSAWDGRDAIVVAGDIALYDTPAARPSGGAGCIAMLVGPEAPLVVVPGARGTFMKHMYDFYKPNFGSEYPILDGHYSISCYLEAVDQCYRRFWARKAKVEAQRTPVANGTVRHGHADTSDAADIDAATASRTPLDEFDHFIFHAPFCKLVSKAYARMLFNDFRSDPQNPAFAHLPSALKTTGPEDLSFDRAVEKLFVDLSRTNFEQRVRPGLTASTMCGNMYTASVYSGLVSLLSNVGSEALQGKRVGVFSYGGGLASSMFSLLVRGDVGPMAETMDLLGRLDARRTVPAEEYDQACALRERAYQQKNYTPEGSVEALASGTYYLAKVDERFQRTYEVKA